MGPIGGWEQSGDPFASLLRWAADERARRDRAERVRQASLRRQAADSCRWLGVLLDLAERAEPVELTLRTGVVRGVVTSVGADFCAVHDGTERVLVAASAIGQVESPGELPWGFRGVPRVASLAEVLHELSRERPVVQVRSRIGPTRTGRLERAGADVVTVRTDHPHVRSVSINLAVVDAVALST